ncbi:DUF2946 family protein [Ensifer sp. 2YAB10]|uniref:DUF2946 family protein n=1 Tax=Ensifer sp. 2YAB10 TaxID=3233021 RepID=UPI003F904CF2
MVRRRNSWGLAFFAACLFVLQSIAGTFAASSMAAVAQIDPFGNALCASVDHASKDNHDSGHGSAADCCLLGCCVSSQVLAAAPEAFEVFTFQVTSATEQYWPAAAPSPRGEHRPGYPRAPPRLLA